jgi:hypothetical protein
MSQSFSHGKKHFKTLINLLLDLRKFRMEVSLSAYNKLSFVIRKFGNYAGKIWYNIGNSRKYGIFWYNYMLFIISMYNVKA